MGEMPFLLVSIYYVNTANYWVRFQNGFRSLETTDCFVFCHYKICIHTVGAHVESQKSWLHKKCSSQVKVSSAFPPIKMIQNITQFRIDIFFFQIILGHKLNCHDDKINIIICTLSSNSTTILLDIIKVSFNKRNLARINLTT